MIYVRSVVDGLGLDSGVEVGPSTLLYSTLLYSTLLYSHNPRVIYPIHPIVKERIISTRVRYPGTEGQERVAPLGKRQNDRYAVKNVGKGT